MGPGRPRAARPSPSLGTSLGPPRNVGAEAAAAIILVRLLRLAVVELEAPVTSFRLAGANAMAIVAEPAKVVKVSSEARSVRGGT